MKARQYRRRGQETTTLTNAVTHIRLSETNACKLAALDALAPVYQCSVKSTSPIFAQKRLPINSMIRSFSLRCLNAGIGSPFNRRQASLARGEPIENRPIKAIWKRWRTTWRWWQRQTLVKKNRSTLNRRTDGWWLTLSYDEKIAVQTEPDAQVIGVDVGIANFLTTSDGKHYGTFHGKLRERQKRDREKRRR
jgi:hypothetical protein